MKLRRAAVAVATTAVIVPAALLGTSVAYAEDSPAPTDSPSASAPADPAPSDTAVPTVSPTQVPTTDPTTTGDPGKPTGTPTTPGAPTKGGPTATASDTPDPDPTPCTDSDTDPDSVLTLSVSGLPSKLVKGGGWQSFTMTAGNPTDQSLGDVQWLLAIDSQADLKHPLGEYAHMEYFDSVSKQWVSVEDEIGTGILFGDTDLGAHSEVAIKMRVKVDAKAPVGASGAFGFGGYLDANKNCVHFSYVEYDFTVVAPKPGGGSGTPAPPAKPNPGAKPPSHVKTQEGGTTKLPVTGSLADTGSSSTTPYLAGLGAAAIVVVGGAMFVVRRRKAATTA
jgi:LPXTG-motif cell wall-anchored protein